MLKFALLACLAAQAQAPWLLTSADHDGTPVVIVRMDRVPANQIFEFWDGGDATRYTKSELIEALELAQAKRERK